MINTNFHVRGRHFLQIPGPSPVPDRILNALSLPTIDHRGPEFGALGLEVVAKTKEIFKTQQPVVIYAACGTGAWEAALSNTLDPGDAVLMYETGYFATLWRQLAERIGLVPEVLSNDKHDSWRYGVDANLIEDRLRKDKEETIRAVCVVHNETSTGVTSDIASVRAAIDAAGHSALLLVDSISGLGCTDYRHDEWGVDVTISGSQKGLMLPPGISFNAISNKAIAASKSALMKRAYWDWTDILRMNADGYWPSTPNTNLLYALNEACDMLLSEKLDTVFARHARWAAGVRTAVNAWGLEIQCIDREVYSPVLTGVRMPNGVDADLVRKLIHERFDCSLGAGLGRLKGTMFRIGHLGDTNDLTLIAALAACEMGLQLSGVTIRASGVEAGMRYFSLNAVI